MGAGASKPVRKLGKSVSETATKNINRSQGVNQLPPQALKEKFQHHYNEQNTPDESLNQSPVGTVNSPSNISFDSAKLKKKLASKQMTVHNTNQHSPEGKDGMDPQVEGTDPYDKNYVNSINNLGKQIHSISLEQDPLLKKESMALKQLSIRKQLFEEGEKELQSQMDPHGPLSHSSNGGNGHEVIRTMVHPRTLGAIINDIHDPRIDDGRIILDFQLHPNFVKELGTRFKVATNTVIMEEKAKDGEIGHRNAPPTSTESMSDENGELGEAMDSDRLKKLKGRLSLDD
ncbi:uncharacterized protein RJT20DRAFT_124686 [Scheffersomyces xylosifermentans]|uniref:uncharacterized protein n=1 Tax=Scheffersomyces xylosifermentans TaxID=1304137 RepID=UPI00315D6113